MRAADADNGKPVPGALWQVKSARLSPGDSSAARMLTFRLVRPRPASDLPVIAEAELPGIISFSARLLAP